MRQILSFVCLLVLSLSFVSDSNAQEQLRTWTDSSGKFNVEAKFIRYDGKQVVLAKPDGKAIRLPLDKLSEEDQKYVKAAVAKLRAARKSEKKAKSVPAPPAEGQMLDDRPSTSSTSRQKNDWYQWRGPGRDGISGDKDLMESWESKKPKLLWSARGAGRGMASVVIADGRIFTLGKRDGREKLIAFQQSDGQEIWSADLGQDGESNGTPTVDGEHVYAVGLKGDLICCKTKTGRVVWQKNYASDFGGKMMSEWGFSESPLIDGDKLICTPGGPRAMIVALNKKTGETIWKTPMRPGGERGTDGAGYASVVISQGGGVKQYITLVGRGLISVDAKSGKPLWQYEKIANGTANVPTPIVDGDFVFCSSGYGDGGSALLKLVGRRGSVGIQEVYYKPARDLQNHHGGMIKIGDHIYMGHGHNAGFPMCIEMKTGRKSWERQRGPGSGSAAVAAADGHLYFRYENGIMALIEADPRGYKLKGSFRIETVNGKSWPHPVICDKKLYLRDQDNIHCYDLSE